MVLRAGQALRPDHQHDQEDQLAREDLVGGIDLGAELLHDAQQDPSASVPHSDPSPPITTASKAKSSS